MDNPQPLIRRNVILPFILITCLYPIIGFANDFTNPMIAAFKTVLNVSNAKASLLQFAYYGGYASMVLPAACFAQQFNQKNSIMLGLILFITGTFLFLPSSYYSSFGLFMVAFYFVTSGLAFIETTSNPYILTLGSKETATRRLSLAQAFNPIGSFMGMFIASQVVLDSLWTDKHLNLKTGVPDFSTVDNATILMERNHDLSLISQPYYIVGAIVFVLLVAIKFTPMIFNSTTTNDSPAKSFQRLWKNKTYCKGVFTQFFVVGATVVVWTFTIHYAEHLGLDKATAQKYNILALIIFLCARFIGTYLTKHITPRRLLFYFGLGAIICTLGAIIIVGNIGLYLLVGISFFMSVMYPTVYGVALNTVGNDRNYGSAGLVLAMFGGAIFPSIQGAIIDMGTIWKHPAVNISYAIPLFCFVVITSFAYKD